VKVEKLPTLACERDNEEGDSINIKKTLSIPLRTKGREEGSDMYIKKGVAGRKLAQCGGGGGRMVIMPFNFRWGVGTSIRGSLSINTTGRKKPGHIRGGGSEEGITEGRGGGHR